MGTFLLPTEIYDIDYHRNAIYYVNWMQYNRDEGDINGVARFIRNYSINLGLRNATHYAEENNSIA